MNKITCVFDNVLKLPQRYLINEKIQYEIGLEFDEDYPKDQNSAENKPKLNSEDDVSW